MVKVLISLSSPTKKVKKIEGVIMKIKSFLKFCPALLIIILFVGISCESNVGTEEIATTEQAEVEALNILSGETVTLYAGQHMDVGEVEVTDDGTELTVTFRTTGEWCLLETHVHVWENEEDLPVNDKGNPVPGQFDYSDTHECEVEASYTIPLSNFSGTDLLIAAHAVVQKTTTNCEITEYSGIIYGIERNTGDIYAVDVVAGTASLEFSSVAPPATNVSPNGLGFDNLNERMYYANYRSGVSPRTLYNYDYGDALEYVSGEIGAENAAADFYVGKYYYMDSFPATDDLYEVTFNADGTILANTKVADISGNSHAWTFNGDIAIKDEILHGWGHCSIHGEFEFFTYDLSSLNFVVHNIIFQESLQLAFGSDGILYGHRSGGTGDFYEINTADGSVSGPITMSEGSQFLYTDCASGLICESVTETETAWGAGVRFVEQGNWGTYFMYTVVE